MERRVLLKALAGSAVVWPLQSLAESAPLPIVGVFLFSTPEDDDVLPFFRKGLAELGFTEGKNLKLEFRSADGKFERFAEVAADLVRLRPDVIVSFGTDLAIAAKKATNSIPIVFISSGDPIQAGLAQSLSHPSLNATGFTLVFDDIAPRRLQLLKECAPEIRRVGFLWNPLHVDHEVENINRAAKTLGVEIVNLEVRGAKDVERALEGAKTAGIDSLYVVTARVTIFFQKQILKFAFENKLPMASGLGAWAEKGALLSYGPDLYQVATQTATDVSKVLKGSRPGDIPIAQPTNFKLSLNLATAKALNLTLPTSLLATADKVVEQ